MSFSESALWLNYKVRLLLNPQCTLKKRDNIFEESTRVTSFMGNFRFYSMIFSFFSTLKCVNRKIYRTLYSCFNLLSEFLNECFMPNNAYDFLSITLLRNPRSLTRKIFTLQFIKKNNNQMAFIH